MPGSDIGIDLGTRNSLVYSTTKGLLLTEPSVVVYDKNTEKIRAIGEEARSLAGKQSSNIEMIWPIRQGVIVDYEILEKMLKHFISKAMGRRAFLKPRITVCVPSGTTEIEGKALEEAIYQSGARMVYLARGPVASAIGAGLDITKPFGNMVVDIGGGSTDVAVLSVGGIVVQNTIKVAGDNFSRAIMNYIREKHSIFISEDMAEEIKLKIGTVVEEAFPKTMEVRGRNVNTGLPKMTALSSEEVREALRDTTGQVMECIHGVLEKTPPELAADIVDRGILLTGGGALLKGMDVLVEEKTGIHAVIVRDALTVTVTGTGKYADVMARM